MTALLLGACGSDTLDPAGGSTSANSFSDGSNTVSGQRSAITLSSRLKSTSADGSEADLVVSYRLDESVRASLRKNSRIRVDLKDETGQNTTLMRAGIDSQSLQGDLDITVPVNAGASELAIGLEGIKANVVTDLAIYSTINLPTVLRRQTTDLDSVTIPHIELIEDSYTSFLEDNRRKHRFAVTVSDLAQGSTTGPDGKPAGLSITGLEEHVSRYFIAEEGGIRDIESPVSADYSQQNLNVYLVVDVSSSITYNNSAHHVLDAIARTVIALRDVADFNIRVFAGDVYELNSLRDIAFDDLDDSGTALYRALDTALDKIDQHGDSGRDTVLIAFTDGRDFSSRNFYPAFRSHEQVREYVEQRIVNVSTVQREIYSHRMETYLVSLGGDVDEQSLEQLAQASGGQYLKTYDKSTIDQQFGELTSNIKGVYYLEYSSQQQPDDTLITLQVEINGATSNTITLPTKYGDIPR
ncbi:MAG: VWA domain-containing protein [Rhodothermales bacterium]|nr:VWA domain-containing protein [Rhodothermales bacterium]